MIILIIQFKCKIKQKTVILYENRSNFLRSERLQKNRIIVSFLLIFSRVQIRALQFTRVDHRLIMRMR
jgi:hypothetical protein